jgi:hypothetical protein
VKMHLEYKYIELIKKHEFLVIAILIFLASMIYIVSFASPKIYISAQVKSVTEKDYFN